MENSTDSKPVLEDGWVCSVGVGPDRHGNEYLNRALQEHYALKQAVNLWQGPKIPRLLFAHRSRTIVPKRRLARDES